MVLGQTLNFVTRTQHHAHALVQLGGLQVQDALLAVGGRAAGLLDQPAHRVGLVHQPQLAGLLGLALVPRVHEHAAAHQDAVHVGHHARNPAHVEVLAARAFLAGQALVDVALHGHVPVAHVAHVDREFLGVRRNLDVFLRQHEAALLAVQREHGHAVAHGEHQRSLRAVDAVARGDLLRTGLQKVGLLHAGGVVGLLEHAENGADAHVHVDVAAAVERVEHQEVFALRVAVGHHVDAVHFLAGHGREVAAPFVGLDEHLVGDDVQLLLDLALHVLALGRAEHAAQRTLVDGLANALARTGHHFEQQAQLARNEAVGALLLDEVAGEGNLLLLSHGMCPMQM